MLPKIGDVVKRVSRNGAVHYGLVTSYDQGWCEVHWLDGIFSPTLDPVANLEVVSQAQGE